MWLAAFPTENHRRKRVDAIMGAAISPGLQFRARADCEGVTYILEKSGRNFAQY